MNTTERKEGLLHMFGITALMVANLLLHVFCLGSDSDFTQWPHALNIARLQGSMKRHLLAGQVEGHEARSCQQGTH